MTREGMPMSETPFDTSVDDAWSTFERRLLGLVTGLRVGDGLVLEAPAAAPDGQVLSVELRGIGDYTFHVEIPSTSGRHGVLGAHPNEHAPQVVHDLLTVLRCAGNVPHPTFLIAHVWSNDLELDFEIDPDAGHPHDCFGGPTPSILLNLRRTAPERDGVVDTATVLAYCGSDRAQLRRYLAFCEYQEHWWRDCGRSAERQGYFDEADECQYEAMCWDGLDGSLRATLGWAPRQHRSFG